MNRILVIVVTYNAMQWADRCFGSLMKSSINPDAFVVDNGSVDGTVDFIKTHYPEAKIYQNKTNIGFGRANNIGIQYAIDNNYDYVYLLNQDAWVMPDTLDGLVRINIENPEYGLLSPMQLYADLERMDKNFSSSVFSSNPNIIKAFNKETYLEVGPVIGVMAAHWLISRECILRVGGFSPSFQHYGEDYNYADRVRYHGLKVGVSPLYRAVHDRENREESVQKKAYLTYASSIRLMSNPFISMANGLVKAFVVNMRVLFRFGTFWPLFYFAKLIYNVGIIYRNKKISMCGVCPFLDTK